MYDVVRNETARQHRQELVSVRYSLIPRLSPPPSLHAWERGYVKHMLSVVEVPLGTLQEKKQAEEERIRKEKEMDYLAPFLARIGDPLELTRKMMEEVAEVRSSPTQDVGRVAMYACVTPPPPPLPLLPTHTGLSEGSQ